MGAPILLGILFFFILCLGAADSIKGTVMVVAVFTLFIIAARFKVLRDRVHWPFIALTLVVIMDGISTFYAVSGKFALREFLKVFLAYLLAVILLATSPKKEETVGKRIATILAVATAVGSLIGIDLISTGWISGAVVRVLGHFTEAYEEYSEAQALYRMASIFSNANVYAGVSGIGVLLGLGLSYSSDTRKERSLFLTLLYLNAVAFILTISLGAFFFTILAVIVFILMQPKEKCYGAIVVILEAMLLAIVSAAMIFKMREGENGARRYLPLLSTIIGAVVLCLLDCFVGYRITSKLEKHRKVAAITFGVFCVLVIAYAIAALTVTGELELNNEKSISVLFPKPGEYTLTAEADDEPIIVAVTCQSFQQSSVSAYNSTSLYYGNLSDAAFSVPENCIVLSFWFRRDGQTIIHKASYGDHKIPLSYQLLPEFIASRLGQARTIHNVIQRLVYFLDGLKLFNRSPLVGLGIGAFENGIKSVQSFYYETKYAHNHYFQSMLETGIIGLILFLFLLVSSAVAIWKSRKEHPFAPMLGAALVFMAGQAIHDIVFSAYAYLPIAYGSFAMINLCCGQEIKKPKLTNTFKTVAIVVSSVCIVVYCGFLAGNLMAKRNMEKNATMQTLVQSVKLDHFEWADYALAYVTNAMGDNVNPYVRQQADAYAERLAGVNSNTIPIYLAEYYFQSDRSEQGIDMLRKYVDYVSSDQSAWRNAFTVLRTYDDGSESFQSGAVQLADMLETWNNENLGTITLDDETNAYIAACRQ